MDATASGQDEQLICGNFIILKFRLLKNWGAGDQMQFIPIYQIYNTLSQDELLL